MPSSSPHPPRLGGRRLTIWSLSALAAGLLLGLALHGSSQPAAATLEKLVTPIGRVWMVAVQFTVIPLVVTQLFLAILGSGGVKTVGLLGLKAVGFFILLLVLGGCFALLVGPPIISLYQVDPATIAGLRAGTSIPEAARTAQAAGSGSGGLFGWISLHGLVAGSGDLLLGVLLGTLVFALVVSLLGPPRREAVLRVVRPLSALALTVIGWLLLVTPLAVFALTFVLVRHAGWSAAGFMTAFILIVSAVLLGFAVLLYPFTMLLGKVSVRQFARAVAPAQLVAASSRSSLAALPALVEGARDVLQLPPAASGFVLPLAVSVFKVNRTISTTTKLLFLAHAFGVSISPGRMVVFLVTIVLLSFVTPPIPAGGSTAFTTLPAYLAAGAPIEGVVILQPLDVVSDIFRTITNVTANLSVATILTRRGVETG